jgi:dTDP-4-dehydrorhamnose reductase
MRILVTGANGQLGAYLLRELLRHDHDIVAWSGSGDGGLFGVNLQAVDLAERDAVVAAFRGARPTHVIHAAARSTVVDCYTQPRRAEQVNVEGSRLLAELAAESGARLVFVSTDMVFDGARGNYHESDPVAPLSVYGRSKVRAEEAVSAYPRTAIARVALLFGPSLVGRTTFFTDMVHSLRGGRVCRLFADEWRTPLNLATAAQGLVALAGAEFVGTVHLGGRERMSRLEMGQRLAACLGADRTLIVPAQRADAALLEPRPRDTSLDSSLWRRLFPDLPWPMFEEAVRQFADL